MRPPADIAEDAIKLFIEYRDVHGCSEEDALVATLCEFYDGEDYDLVAKPAKVLPFTTK